MKDQNNRGMCACEEEQKMNEVCGDVWVPGRDKIKPSDSKMCVCVCMYERESMSWRVRKLCGEWVTEGWEGETSHLQP